MKLKLFMLVTSLIIVLAGSNVYDESAVRENSDPDIGRYQLFQGTYTSIDLKRQQTSTHTSIFLIDTRTGKVKRYLNKIDEEGKYIEMWVPTEITSEK